MLTLVEIEAQHFARARQVQRLLASRSRRGRKIPDLLIAAAAEDLKLIVLHYDADFDRIAPRPGRRVRGSFLRDGALMAWQYGDVVVARDVMDGKPWLAMPQYVVDDTADLLVTYLPEGTPIGYLPDSDHPWYPQPAGRAPGKLELRRPGDTYSVAALLARRRRRVRACGT